MITSRGTGESGRTGGTPHHHSVYGSILGEDDLQIANQTGEASPPRPDAKGLGLTWAPPGEEHMPVPTRKAKPKAQAERWPAWPRKGAGLATALGGTT